MVPEFSAGLLLNSRTGVGDLDIEAVRRGTAGKTQSCSVRHRIDCVADQIGEGLPILVWSQWGAKSVSAPEGLNLELVVADWPDMKPTRCVLLVWGLLTFPMWMRAAPAQISAQISAQASAQIRAQVSAQVSTQVSAQAGTLVSVPVSKDPAPAVERSGAKRLPLKGVPDFGEVTPTLYRGGQPRPE